jgi:NADH:ubiquinone oxidoreductase subunit 5 (subunit L)/multisubunit Na+/H+ antiporter MnhA subunit
LNTGILVLSIVVVPILGALLLPLTGIVSEKFRNGLSLFLVLFALVISISLLPKVLGGQLITYNKAFQLGMNITFVADNLAVFMAIVSSLISAIIVFYSFGYIEHYENRNEYYLMVVLFLGAMMGIVYSSNLVLLYLFWEITGLVSWRLIGFFRGKSDVLMADKAFIITVFGALLMLLGFISLYKETGSFDLLTIKHMLGTHPISNITVLLILAGIFSKSATLPFHTWLPDAGVAPSPVTALLHAAVLVKIGVYVLS